MNLNKSKIKALQEERARLESGGGKSKIVAQHDKGKLTARERIEKLLDANSFVEHGLFAKHRCKQLGMEERELPADAVITGFGSVNGRSVFVFAQDFTVMAGSAGPVHQKKIAAIAQAAYKSKTPLIGLYDSAGARLQEGSENITFSRIFYQNARCSGVIPQIAAIMGPAAGGSSYSPALMDFIIMSKKKSYMFITGPPAIKAYTGEEISSEELGGSSIHCRKSGGADLEVESDEECIEMIKKLLSYLPSSCLESPPQIHPKDDPERLCPKLEEIIPEDREQPYDIHSIIEEIIDQGSFNEIKPDFARNTVIGFARMNGRSVGIVANQPETLAGNLDIDGSDKISRFIRFLDAFNIPIITLTDTPGFLPGVQQEHNGVIRHGAKVLYAYSEASVPMITILLRKAYGGAWAAMGPKELGVDIVYAWPFAECASMPPEAAVEVIWGREIQNSPDPEAARGKYLEEYDRNFANPYLAAALLLIDDVIAPAETRKKIIQDLQMLEKKESISSPRKHGIMPV